MIFYLSFRWSRLDSNLVNFCFFIGIFVIFRNISFKLMFVFWFYLNGSVVIKVWIFYGMVKGGKYFNFLFFVERLSERNCFVSK